MPRPLLILIAGRPGAGKTTLARAVAAAIRCPMISRDEVKEGIVHSLADAGEAVPPDEVHRLANRAFFDVVERLLTHGVTLVIEAAFQHRLWSPHVERFATLARVRIIVCAPDPAIARARHIARGLADPERSRFHADEVIDAARAGRSLPIADWTPPTFDVPTLTIDTATEATATLESVLRFVRQAEG